LVRKIARCAECDLNDAVLGAPVGDGQGGFAGELCAVCFFAHGWSINQAASELIARVVFGGTELNCNVVSSPIWQRSRIMKQARRKTPSRKIRRNEKLSNHNFEILAHTNKMFWKIMQPLSVKSQKQAALSCPKALPPVPRRNEPANDFLELNMACIRRIEAELRPICLSLPLLTGIMTT